MNKVLIIKTGYSEVLDKESNTRRVSLGDILRITSLLNVYKEDYITWVTDKEALPLLEGNNYIDRLLTYDFTTAMQLESEEYDTVINLEKIPGICALADKIKAWKKYGFRLDSRTGKAEAYDRSFEVLVVSSDMKAKIKNKRTLQELLFEMVGEKWNGEEYILGYQPKNKEKYDVGFNTEIGQKWPTKRWSVENWNKLEKMLKQENFSVSRQDKQEQEILHNLYNYMDWINSCKLIISNDSLGLHLGLALKKKVLGLFGPTPYKEVYFYNRGKAILPESIPNCMPCFKGKCERGRNCMEDITPKRVLKEIKKRL